MRMKQPKSYPQVVDVSVSKVQQVVCDFIKITNGYVCKYKMQQQL